MYLPYRPLCTKGRATDFAGILFFCKTFEFLQTKKNVISVFGVVINNPTSHPVAFFDVHYFVVEI